MRTVDLTHRVRPPAGEASGALVLLHGRGADESDLFPLFDLIDPERRLVGVAPRGPLSLPPGGAHWYVVRRVGYPDPATFWPTYETLTSWLDRWLADQGITPAATVIGGFSQGAVMSYATALGRQRPRPAGIIALSGFIPAVDDWELQSSTADGLPVFVAHGTHDPVIEVGFGRSAAQRLKDAGADVVYRE